MLSGGNRMEECHPVFLCKKRFEYQWEATEKTRSGILVYHANDTSKHICRVFRRFSCH